MPSFTKPITFIGDIHGRVSDYVDLTEKHACTLQLGDFGAGFRQVTVPTLAPEHRAIYGNHDNPTYAKSLPLFLGDYGVWNGVFYVAGGFSIDREWRTTGVSWWPDEEITCQEWNEIIRLFGRQKPRYVATHDCPTTAFERILGGNVIRNRTQSAFEEMFRIHKPELWVFGHHHRSVEAVIEGCRFRGLNEMEIATEQIEIPLNGMWHRSWSVTLRAEEEIDD